MYDNRFRNSVARSEFTLPAVLVVSIAVWLALGAFIAGFVDVLFGCMAVCAAAYVVMEWANANALLRIRSRLITTTFLALTTACPFFYAWNTDFIVTICMALCYVFLFQSYQNHNAVAAVFHAFFFVGVASVFYQPVVYLVLPLYISLFVHLRSLTLRTFVAGLLGLLTPYWVWMVYALWNGTLATAWATVLDGLECSLPDFGSLSSMQMASGGVMIFYGLLATTHFLRTAFNDKIRTRMYFYVLTLQELCLLSLMLLFPLRFDAALRLFILCASPFVAHYFALARGKWKMNVWFVFTLFVLAVLWAYNYYCLWTL